MTQTKNDTAESLEALLRAYDDLSIQLQATEEALARLQFHAKCYKDTLQPKSLKASNYVIAIGKDFNWYLGSTRPVVNNSCEAWQYTVLAEADDVCHSLINAGIQARVEPKIK